MPERLRLWLNQTDPRELTPADMPLALGALLVRIARSDKAYVQPEMDEIDRILSLRHDLTAAEAADLRAMCETVEQDAPDTARFAEIIRDAVPYTERLAIALALWDVMMADGVQRPEESAIVALSENVLGITRGDLPRGT